MPVIWFPDSIQTNVDAKVEIIAAQVTALQITEMDFCRLMVEFLMALMEVVQENNTQNSWRISILLVDFLARVLVAQYI